jgi:thiol-disulfide isomerase/thioredoxin
MNKFIVLIAVKVLAFVAFVGLVVFMAMPASAANFKPFDGETPALALDSMQGEAMNLEQFKGKVVLVQFWATYCTPCRVEMPSMNRLQAKLGDQFKILAINMGEEMEEVQQFVDEVKPEFTILMDTDGSALAEWKVFVAPASFLIDTTGKIRYTLYGATEWDSEETILQLKELM